MFKGAEEGNLGKDEDRGMDGAGGKGSPRKNVARARHGGRNRQEKLSTTGEEQGETTDEMGSDGCPQNATQVQ